MSRALLSRRCRTKILIPSLPFSDPFTRANAPTLGVDYDSQDKFSVKSNQATIDNTVTIGTGYAVRDVGVADVAVSAKIVGDISTSGIAAGVILRWQDASNHFWFDGRSGGGQLYRRAGGSDTVILTSPNAFANGDTVKIAGYGSSITMFKNGVAVASTTDSNFLTATKHGIRGTANGFASVVLDDLLIEASSAPPSFFENFTYSDGVNPPGYSFYTGSGYSSPIISSNRLVPATSSASYVIHKDLGFVPRIAQFDFITNNRSQPGSYTQFQFAGTGLTAGNYFKGGVAVSHDGTFRIYSRDASGTATLRATGVTRAIAVGDQLQFVRTISAGVSTYTAYLAGSQVAQWVDSGGVALLGTYIGIDDAAGTGTANTVDNWSATV